MIASRSCCIFVGCTSMMRISVPPHPKGALLDWDLVTVEAIWVKWTHWHVQETSLRWFELYESGRLWRLNNAQLVLRGPKCAKKISPTHYTTTTSLNHWDKAGWIHAFMFFKPNSEPPPQKNRDSSEQATFFQSSIVQFWWACANCSLHFLFLADRSGTRCGLLLL